MIVIIWERVFPPVVVWPRIPSRILVNVCYANPISIRYMHVLNSKICHMNTRLLLWKLTTLCMNCFSSNHFVKHCKSVHRCKRCQKPHHTLLHVANTDASPATIRYSNIAAPPLVPQSMEYVQLHISTTRLGNEVVLKLGLPICLVVSIFKSEHVV